MERRLRARFPPPPPPKARPGFPACDWDATRAAYLDRFGPFLDAHLVAVGKDPPFYVLSFWDSARPGATVVYASFGAPEGEVFLEAAAPALGVGALVEEAARAFLDELPAVVRARCLWTPFGGVILLPEEEGGFRVPAGDGKHRPVRRAIAITRRERTHALYESVAEVLPKVCAAGAEIADVFRDCTIAPKETASFRALVAPASVRYLRRSRAGVARRLAEQRARGAPGEDTERLLAAHDAGLSHLTAALPPVLTDADVAVHFAAADEENRYAIVMMTAVQRGIDGVVSDIYDLPAAMTGFQRLLLMVVAAHPDAHPLVTAAVALSSDVPVPESLAAEEERALLRKRLAQVAEVLSEAHPEHGEDDLLRLAVEAVDAAYDPEDPDHTPVYTARAGWPVGVRAMLVAVLPRRTRDERALLAAYSVGLSAGLGVHEAEGDTPRERLGRACERFAGLMLMGYSMGISREMEAEAN